MSLLVAVNGVTCRYGDAASPPLRMPDISVARGAHSLLLGPSGSGKSTLINCIAGLQAVDTGSVVIDGTDIVPKSARERDQIRAAKIGLVMQRLHLVSAMTVRQNLALARTLAGRPADASLIAHLAGELGILNKLDIYPRQLSQGEAQRAAIARALVNQPAILLADEPTSALDDRSCDAAINLLFSQVKQHNATLIVATHDARIKPAFGDVVQLGGT
jgi:putative ABC transport system ATP-binding protein